MDNDEIPDSADAGAPHDSPAELDVPNGGEPPAATFPMVGIGASAGGLTAFEKFFSGMPADVLPGMAVVLVQHLAPYHKSILTDLVRRYTRMQVFEVAEGMKVQQNCVYIIPCEGQICRWQLLSIPRPPGEVGAGRVRARTVAGRGTLEGEDNSPRAARSHPPCGHLSPAGEGPARTALAAGWAGVHPASVAADIAPERLAKDRTRITVTAAALRDDQGQVYAYASTERVVQPQTDGK